MAILAALAPGDVNLKLRNKLYAALKRIMMMAENEKVHVPGAVVARYHEAVKSSKGVKGPNALWNLMKEWCQDTTCAKVSFSEHHVRESMKYATTEWMWITRIECIVMFHGHVWEEGMKHAEKMLGLAKKTKPNPIAPKDPDLKLYRMQRAMLEGEVKT